MAKIVAITVLIIYLLVYYVALFVEPGMEKQWMQEERELTVLQVNFIKCSRFLSSYGIFLTVFVVGIVAYICGVSSERDDAED